jgi:hypothetical protein
MRLFTVLDCEHFRACTSAEVGQAWVPRWTVDDLDAGLCVYRDLGKDKPPPAPDESVGPSTDVPLGDQLKSDVMSAYRTVGGPAYLKTMATEQPANFLKLLTKILPQSIEAKVESSTDIRHLALVADKMWGVRAAHGLCLAYPWTTITGPGRRVVEVGQLTPQQFLLMESKVNFPKVPGQHFVEFEERGGKWQPVEIRDADFNLLEDRRDAA